MSDQVLFALEDGVATVTLHRPEKLNAFVGTMREELLDAVECAAGAGAEVLVLTGAGAAFCSGGDVRGMAELRDRGASFDELRPWMEAGARVVRRIADLGIPTLAAVNGVAAGAGLNLALACDLRLASDRATFTESFVRIGLHPDWGGTYFLPRRVGMARALEMCWTGERIDAEQAARIGLVNRVVPHERLMGDARALAARLASAPRASIRLAKETLRSSLGLSLTECLEAEIEAQRECWASADVTEGVRAFVEKREPRFGRGAPAWEGTKGSRFE